MRKIFFSRCDHQLSKGEKNMDKTIFSILLNRKNKVLINENDLHSDTEQSVVTGKDKCIVATMNKNLEPLGYTMSEGLFNLFMKMESDQRNRIYLCLISKK